MCEDAEEGECEPVSGVECWVGLLGEGRDSAHVHEERVNFSNEREAQVADHELPRQAQDARAQRKHVHRQTLPRIHPPPSVSSSPHNHNSPHLTPHSLLLPTSTPHPPLGLCVLQGA